MEKRDVLDIVIRYLVCLGLVLLYNQIYFILLPLTFYFSYFLAKFFIPIMIVDYSFIFDSVKLNFVDACVATSAYLLLIILVFTTFGLKWKKRIKITFFGLVIIYLVNILRIEFLLFILYNYGYNAFERIHLIIWEFVSSMFVVVLWIFLVKKYSIKYIPVISDLKKIYKIKK